jgi:hypothetical protein
MGSSLNIRVVYDIQLGKLMGAPLRRCQRVATLALGSRPRQKGCKVAGQEEARELRQEETRESRQEEA